MEAEMSALQDCCVETHRPKLQPPQLRSLEGSAGSCLGDPGDFWAMPSRVDGVFPSLVIRDRVMQAVGPARPRALGMEAAKGGTREFMKELLLLILCWRCHLQTSGALSHLLILYSLTSSHYSWLRVKRGTETKPETHTQQSQGEGIIIRPPMRMWLPYEVKRYHLLSVVVECW